MISKTSFFNKGIYKSTIKRYAWGSALYFVILLLSTVLQLFLNADRAFSYMPPDYFKEYPVILHGSYIAIPMLLAIVVPTVAALLIFRFIHSKKQAIFIHSLPVSRRAVFNSSLLAGFTLMLVPVIITGIMLLIISLCGYGDYFGVRDCFIWLGYNIFGIVTMFSCAVFSATLTGNSFAMVVINILIHSFLFITVSTLSIMAEVFVYGFTETNAVYDTIMENNFAVVTFGFAEKYFREGITLFKIAELLVAAIAIYTGAYFLYKKRRMETATDVAGYKCLNGIFKYLVTFIATMFAFAVFSLYIEENTAVFIIIIALISIIAYAASEMLLKKTLNVLYSWKGYLGFAAVFLAIIGVFAGTTFFGYETRVPQKSEIAEAALYEYYYYEEPFTTDPELIDMILDTHKEFTEPENIPTMRKGDLYGPINTRVHIKYKLKNGKTINRAYSINQEKCVEILNRFYEKDEYVKLVEAVLSIDEADITGVFVNYDKAIEDTKGLLAALRKDIFSLSYEDLSSHLNNTNILYNLRIEHIVRSETDNKGIPQANISGIQMEITDKYENTINWLSENGYAGYIEVKEVMYD